MIESILKTIERLPEPLRGPSRDFLWRIVWNLMRGREFCSSWVLPGKLTGSERAMLAEAIGAEVPFTSICEIGCGFGQNLELISSLFPQARVVGVDSNPDCVDGARKLLQKRKSVTIINADACNLEEFRNQEFDLVISCAALLYINSENIPLAASEMLRICRRRIILMELNLPNPFYDAQALGVMAKRSGMAGVYWLRDYVQLFLGLEPSCEVSVEPVKRALFQNEEWQTLGNLVKVSLVADSL